MDAPTPPARLAAAPHEREAERLAALDAYGILDTPREVDFDDIAALASEICGTPIAVVNLVGDGRQWFKAEVGLGVHETPLETSFCGHAILEADYLEVPDATKDRRFECNPLVTAAGGIRFYAGALLKTDQGLPIGTLCVLDLRPRELTEQQAGALRRLARQVMAQLELRRALRARNETEARLRTLNTDLERQVTERALARGRTWLLSPEIMGVLNADGFFEQSNPAWNAVLGWSQAEVASTRFFDFVHPDDLSSTQAAWTAALQRGEPALRFENRYRTKGGEWRWLSWVGIPDGGKVYCTGRDIGAEKEQAEELAARTAERDRMWETSPDLMLVIDFDGVFRRVNPAWTTLLGYMPVELVGHHVNEFVIPDDHADTVEAYELAADGGLPRIVNRYRHKDGSIRWISWVAAPAGDLTYATGRDVTAERERAAEIRRYREIVEAMSAPICAFDTEYRLIAFNKAHNDEFGRVNGFETKVGDVFPDLFTPEQAAVMRELMSRALSGETFTVRQEFGRPELGTPIWEISYTPLRDERGRLIGAFHHAVDISDKLVAEAELNAVQEALRQSQKLEAVGQLTGGVAHDFNNLLTIIRSSTDLLRKPGLAEERRRRYVDAIADTVDRAAKLTGQLLAFARRQALKPEVFDTGERLRALTTMLTTLAGSRIRIQTEVPEEPCFVLADVSQFETALINMAVNARDAMDGEGLLVVHVRGADAMPPIRGHAGGPGRFVAVSLSDTGAGIPEERWADIFEPFFTTKEVGKGTGLGLSQVFGFAKQSGGDVAVESEIGRGTTFTLYLPRAEAPTNDAVVGDEHQPERGEDGPPRRLLVVEDNVDVGTFATQLLQDLGYTTTWAANAAEALALLRDGSAFDAVFSDVVMPGMSGVELGQEIRRLYPEMPVVLTSGYSHVLAEEGRHGFELVRKPYAVEELSRTLRRATGRGRPQPA